MKRTTIAGEPIARAKLPAWIDDEDRLWCDTCAPLATRDGVRVTRAYDDDTEPAFRPRCAACKRRFPS